MRNSNGYFSLFRETPFSCSHIKLRLTQQTRLGAVIRKIFFLVIKDLCHVKKKKKKKRLCIIKLKHYSLFFTNNKTGFLCYKEKKNQV